MTDSCGHTPEFSAANDLLSGIGTAAARIDAFCAVHDLPRGITFDVALAVDELVTNATGYGFDDAGEHRIDPALRFEGETLTVEVADDGRAFDPLQSPEPNLSAPLESRARGGLSIYLARNLADGIDCRRQDRRNVVTLTKGALAGETE